MKRCPWVFDDLHIQYHDNEWGVPLHDDRKLFEFLVLDGMQSGLSWKVILRKRQEFRIAFDNFDPKKVSRYSENKIKQLMNNVGIIRNRRKIESAINNADIFLDTQKEFGSFDSYVWSFVDCKPKTNKFRTWGDIPALTKESEEMSKNMKKKGFTFVGPTVCYAFMQTVGMVNDHVLGCFRRNEIKKMI